MERRKVRPCSLITMSNSAKWGGWLLIAASALGLVVALYDFFLAWGIKHSVGSAIVVLSTAVMTVAALLIVLTQHAGYI